jgi:quercetin dioxygenase-like cupin family protein
MAQTQQSGIKRTDLQQHDLGVPGRQVTQARVDIDPGVESPKHSHPGDEIVYVIEGLLKYQVESEPEGHGNSRQGLKQQVRTHG